MRDDLGRTPTPVSLDQARSLLRTALDARGTVVSPDAANVILAHIALENGNGERVIQHNFGNLIATQEWAGDFWRPPWFGDPTPETPPELRRKHELMLQGKAPGAFRAYANAAEGMRFYIGALDSLGLLAAAENGPRSFAAKASLRFSPDADPNALGNSLESIVERIKAGNGEPPSRKADVFAFGVLGVLGLAFALDWLRGKKW